MIEGDFTARVFSTANADDLGTDVGQVDKRNQATSQSRAVQISECIRDNG